MEIFQIYSWPEAIKLQNYANGGQLSGIKEKDAKRKI